MRESKDKGSRAVESGQEAPRRSLAPRVQEYLHPRLYSGRPPDSRRGMRSCLGAPWATLNKAPGERTREPGVHNGALPFPFSGKVPPTARILFSEGLTRA